jgi:hypothetical protein
MKTFDVTITLADGTTVHREVTATSAVDLFDQMRAIAKQYPTYVRSEGSLIRRAA